MKQLSRYIFFQLFFVVGAATLLLTSIVWFAQSLRYIEFIANKGVSFFLFFEMIFYLLPNLVIIVAPIAVLVGVLFIYNKLIADHELVVMRASGVGNWELAKPAILISLIYTFIIFLFTSYFLPLSSKKYRDISVALREKSLTSLLQVGQFNTSGKFTVYARTQDLEGNFLGILIYDGRQKESPVLIMAEKGVIFNKEEGGYIRLLNGNRQEKDLNTGKPSILYFDRYTIEAQEKFTNGKKEGRILRPYERYIGDLLYPKKTLPTSTQLEFISAAHQRLISPLFALAFGLLGTCVLILGHFNRRGRGGRILLACLLASFVEVGTMVFLHTLKYATFMIFLSYSLVIIMIGTCIFLLTQGFHLPLRRKL